MESNNRYSSRKISLNELLNNESKCPGKKLDLGSMMGRQLLSTGQQEENAISAEKKIVKHRSPKEYVAIISMVAASVYLLLISFFPLVYNFTSSFEPVDFLNNLFYFILGVGTLTGVFYLLRKETYLQHIADETFDREIYHRLEPVLRDVAEVHVGLSGMQNQLEMMNMNIENFSRNKSTIAPVMESQLNHYIKYILLINFTLAVFIFMLQYPLGYIPYAVTLLYIIWWAVITLEYKLWNVETVWTWVFIPVIILPLYTILMNAYLQDYQLFGGLFIGLCIYVFSFYSWCTYKVKGILPFDLHDVINNTHEKIKETKKHPEEIIKIANLTSRLSLPSKHQVIMSMLLLAMLLFVATWFGYAIQHDFIPGISWDKLRLNGFVWSVSYTYFLNFLGILLILSGYIYLKKTGT